jgi:hypothetical protein
MLFQIQEIEASFIRDLKITWGERPDYENVKKEHRVYMKCEPVPFHRKILYHLKFMLSNKHTQLVTMN